jgi:hypothetical protein
MNKPNRWVVSVRRSGKPTASVTLPPLEAFAVLHVNVLWYGSERVTLSPVYAEVKGA